MEETEHAAHSLLELLPEELISHILCLLPLPDLLNIGHTNRFFHRLAADDSLWSAPCLDYLGITSDSTLSLSSSSSSIFGQVLPERMTWQQFYIDILSVESRWLKGCYTTEVLTSSAFDMMTDESDLMDLRAARFYYPPSRADPTLVVRVLAGAEEYAVEYWRREPTNNNVIVFPEGTPPSLIPQHRQHHHQSSFGLHSTILCSAPLRLPKNWTLGGDGHRWSRPRPQTSFWGLMPLSQSNFPSPKTRNTTTTNNNNSTNSNNNRGKDQNGNENEDDENDDDDVDEEGPEENPCYIDTSAIIIVADFTPGLVYLACKPKGKGWDSYSPEKAQVYILLSLALPLSLSLSLPLSPSLPLSRAPPPPPSKFLPTSNLYIDAISVWREGESARCINSKRTVGGAP